MKRQWILTMVAVAVLGGCGQAKETDHPPLQDVILYEATDQPQQLVITTYTPFYGNDWKVREFLDLHPEVTIEMNDDFGGDYFKYREYLKTALMSGSGGDVVNIGHSDYIDFGGSPYLMDLNLYMDKDDEFHREDYYETVFDALSVNGRLPVLSSTFSLRYAGVNTAYPQAVDGFSKMETVTIGDMLKLYEKFGGEDLYFTPDYNVRQVIYSPEFADFDIGTVNYTSQKFYDRIDQALKLTRPGAGHMDTFTYFLREFYEEREYLFASVYDEARNVFLPYEEPYMYFPEWIRPVNTFTDFKPVTDEDGKIIMIADSKFGINASAENPGLAWEFIKYLISCGPEISAGYIVDRNYIHKEINRQGVRTAYEVSFWDGTEAPLTEKQNQDIEKALAVIEGNIMKPLAFNQYPFREDLENVIVKLHTGEITPEQAGEQLQGMISLGLME